MSRKKTPIDKNFYIRLKSFLKGEDIPRKKFIAQIGVSSGYLGMVLTGKRGPSAELIAGLHLHYRDFLAWLLTGQEELYNKDRGEDSAKTRKLISMTHSSPLFLK